MFRSIFSFLTAAFVLAACDMGPNPNQRAFQSAIAPYCHVAQPARACDAYVVFHGDTGNATFQVHVLGLAQDGYTPLLVQHNQFGNEFTGYDDQIMSLYTPGLDYVVGPHDPRYAAIAEDFRRSH